MRELSLHILDLVQNSIEADATAVVLEIKEDLAADSLIIRVQDNGRGMDEKIRQLVIDPFITTRTTRRIGLGLPLMEMSSKRCDGYLNIDSVPGKGTTVEAMYRHSHLDRPPLGNMTETIKSIIIANSELQFTYRHSVNERTFTLSSIELHDILGDVPMTHPDVLVWLHDYLTVNIANLRGGVQL